MKKSSRNSLMTFGAVICSISILHTSVVAEEIDNLGDFFTKGDLSLNLRYRLELVDQDNALEDATASTLLTKLGYKTATYQGFQAGLEFTNTARLGPNDFNSTVNGQAGFSVVPDPELTEVNQAYLSYKHKMGSLKAGRYGINLDNQRFVGTVGFRQNDQTFDAFTGTVTPAKDLTASYSYVYNVNTIFGKDSPNGDRDSNIHLLNASYAGLPFGKITAYAYLMEFNDTQTLSNNTFGIRFAGKTKVSNQIKVGYTLEYASQSEGGDSPLDYSADYFHGAANVSTRGLTVGVAYEFLGSDEGTASFATPLATLHKFNGWADVFLGGTLSPANLTNGLQDLSFSAAYKVPGETALAGLVLKVIYHDFRSDVGDIDYGSEWDLLISKKINKYLSASIKAAFYSADSFGVDTDKIWLTIAAKF